MTNKKLTHFFRTEYSKLVSIHSSFFGLSYLELIEDSVQDAFLEATEAWRFSGFPNNPEGWLYKCSKNKCLDRLKYQKVRIDKESELISWYESNHSQKEIDHIINDDLLTMMFSCMNMALKHEDQIALTLKILCGFSSEEISKALL